MKRASWLFTTTLALALCVGCGDDDTDTKPDASTAGKSGKGGSGGSGGGGRGGSSGRTGSSGSTATGGTGTTMMVSCGEPAPTGPVTCGGVVCEAPTDFPNNMCVVPCCVTQGGKELCAAKSTGTGLTTECTLPAKPDPACPDIDAMGMPFKGCCNAAQGKCGIISTLRPGCITQSMLITLPDPLQACSAPNVDADAGTEHDAG